MKCFLMLLCCAGALLMQSAGLHAQDILSFEPGGDAACSKAISMATPNTHSSDADHRTFAFGCAKRDQAIEKVRLNAVRTSIERRSAEERVAYYALLVSFTDFLDSHIANEGCREGTACGAINEEEKARTTYDFLIMAEGFVKEGYPSFTEDDLAREDGALNVVYQKTLSSLPESCQIADPVPRCVSQSRIRDTELDWIRYRDAWSSFGTLRWPQVTSTSLVTYLTRQRIKQLTGAGSRTVPA